MINLVRNYHLRITSVNYLFLYYNDVIDKWRKKVKSVPGLKLDLSSHRLRLWWYFHNFHIPSLSLVNESWLILSKRRVLILHAHDDKCKLKRDRTIHYYQVTIKLEYLFQFFSFSKQIFTWLKIQTKYNKSCLIA